MASAAASSDGKVDSTLYQRTPRGKVVADARTFGVAPMNEQTLTSTLSLMMYMMGSVAMTRQTMVNTLVESANYCEKADSPSSFRSTGQAHRFMANNISAMIVEALSRRWIVAVKSKASNTKST